MLTLLQVTCYVDLRRLMLTFNILHIEAQTHRTDAKELAASEADCRVASLFRLL